MSPFIKTDHLISSSSEQSLILGIRLFVKYMRLFSHPFFSRISPVKRIESTSLRSARYQLHSPRSIKSFSSLTSVICTTIGEATPIYLTKQRRIQLCAFWHIAEYFRNVNLVLHFLAPFLLIRIYVCRLQLLPAVSL